ncbi:DUF397 domain-containing protein [Streptomyces carminius]|uniref:DUF397 domain-containing protein n=1 Tax=Streptomyces carminius TaxID=2665496 RepID=A0A2M8LPG2_9ACTN|nr:DUF397 domain-containing protein [Streptomyces carminius]PJE93810.1 DUF397 domain-containing protein [Streptomyces carminius]
MTEQIGLARAEWRKSSHSSGDGQCVEVAFLGAVVAVRDSKDPDGPVLVSTPGEFSAFVRGLLDGEFTPA